MGEPYKISLGVDVDVSDIQSQINEAANKVKPIPIRIEIENINDIKKEIQSLGNTKTNKNSLTLNTESLEASLKDVSSSIKEIRTSIGTLDNKSGMKSLLSSINQISTALEKASNQFESLNTNLNALAGKDLNLNFGINLGGSNAVSRNAAYGNKVRKETLPQLKQQAEALENYIAQYYKIEDKGKAIVKLTSGSNLFADYWEMSRSIGDSKDSLANQMSTYKKYISLIKEGASLRGIDISSVTSQFSKSADTLVKDAQDVQTGAREMEDSFEKLRQIFSGGNNINIDGISAQLDSIVADLSEIKTALQGLSSGVSLEGLTQSFDRLSDTLEKLVSNATLVKNALGDGLTNTMGIDTGITNKIEQESDATTAAVIQNEKKKQEAYKATADSVVYHAGVVSKLNKAETNGRFYGSNRGTGYFGTGHYFVDAATKHELDNDSYYNKLPYTSIDISQYDNLFKVTSDEIGYALHSFLGNLTRFTQGSDAYDIDELFVQFKNVFGDTIMDAKEFGSRLDQLKTFMLNSSLDDRSDSVSTQFMKSLGYGGVDTRGTSLADTRYGTVIYDLKEESVLQANITDEVQKRGQMLEKIHYEQGQVFDKNEDARIQNILDREIKRREIISEFEKSFDSTNYDKASDDLDKARNRLQEIDNIISEYQHRIDNIDEELFKPIKGFEDLFDDDFLEDLSDDDDFKNELVNEYQNEIEKLSQEKAKLEADIPSLEETYKKEAQLANEAYEQAEQIVEQRHLEAQQAQETANVVAQAEEKKQQAIRETSNVAEQADNQGKQEIQQSQQSANAVVQAEEKKQQTYKETAGIIESLKTTLETMKLDRSSIDTITKDVEELGFAVTDASVKMKNGDFDITVKGIDSMGRVITEIRHLDSATDEISGMGRTISQSFKESDAFIKQQKKSVSDLTNQINQLNRAANDQNASRVIKDSSHLDTLANKYDEITVAIQRMEVASSDTFIDEQNNVKKLISEYKSLVTEFKNAENVATSLRSKDIDTVKSTYSSKLDVLISDMKKAGVYTSGFEKGAENLRSVLSGATDASGLTSFLNGLDKLEAGYKRAAASAKEFNQSQKVGINVSGLESQIKDIQRISPEIDKFEAEIDGAKVSVQSLLNDLKQINTQGDFSVVNARFKAFADAAKAAGIVVTETARKINSISDIKNKLKDTGFDGYAQEVKRMHTAVGELKSSTVELDAALDKLDTSFDAMNLANEANDIEALRAANERYEESLKEVISQLKLKQQLEKNDFKADILQQAKISLNSDIERFLKENTKLSEEFRQKVIALQASLNGLDADGLKLATQQFKSFKKQVEGFGKGGLTFFDNIKKKFKEYSAYFSVAEVFMYAEQALRSMFEQVRAIDTAMTELKKVTDETDASYNHFLSNAASRAKEIGTTIDGLVNSTADFARLGYGFNEAQGLAEVANIYAVVGDDIDSVETATQSLISTLTAFKNEANGLSDSDFALSIVDKMNEVSNNYAISSGGIGEALQRSASSMMAANNTLDETIALITAANTVVQDPASVGQAFKTISMRIRGAKTE